MNLPLIEFKNINQIKPERTTIYIKHKNTLRNYLLLDNNSITLEINDKKIKRKNSIKEMNIRQQLYKKNKIQKIKRKNNIFNRSLSSINKNKPSIRTIIYKNNIIDKNKSDNMIKREYIKNPFNSIKISREISSFIYSSPEKQIKLMNYMMNNHNTNDNKKDIKRLIFPVKNNNTKKDNLMIEEKDEDKTNLNNISLFPLFNGNYDNNNNIIKIENNKEQINNIEKNKKIINCWKNKLLKDILPQNIKTYFKNKFPKENIKDDNNGKLKKTKVIYYRNNNLEIFHSMNTKFYRIKDNLSSEYKKINMLLLNKLKKDNKFIIKPKKSLIRSSSIN